MTAGVCMRFSVVPLETGQGRAIGRDKKKIQHSGLGVRKDRRRSIQRFNNAGALVSCAEFVAKSAEGTVDLRPLIELELAGYSVAVAVEGDVAHGHLRFFVEQACRHHAISMSEVGQFHWEIEPHLLTAEEQSKLHVLGGFHVLPNALGLDKTAIIILTPSDERKGEQQQA